MFERGGTMKLSDNKRKVMEIIWDDALTDENHEITAKDASEILMKKHGWNKTSNYVYFSRLLQKGAISRRYPNYTIKAIIQRDEVAFQAIRLIIEQSFGNSVLHFFEVFIENTALTKADVTEMKRLLTERKPEL